MKKESRHVSELSPEEFLKYFPAPESIYPDWQQCPEHKIWFMFKCYQCIDELSAATLLSQSECICWTLMDKTEDENGTIQIRVPSIRYQYQNFLAENQK